MSDDSRRRTPAHPRDVAAPSMGAPDEGDDTATASVRPDGRVSKGSLRRRTRATRGLSEAVGEHLSLTDVGLRIIHRANLLQRRVAFPALLGG